MKVTITELVVLRKFIVSLIILTLLFSITSLHSASIVSGYAPQQGDYFNYHEVQTVANGTGSYSGYNDQTTTDGGERMDNVSGSTVFANYSYSYAFSDNQGSSTASKVSGSYTWSDSSFLYLSGTDNEQGYTNPTVWFAMNISLPVGGQFVLLNTQMTVMAKNSTFYLPSENREVTTILGQGSGSYNGSPQNSAYGDFSAKYTWNAYFDPTTGYIVGYHYVELDVSPNGNGTGFGYVDDLYLTSSSYLSSTPITTSSTLSTSPTISVTSTSSSSISTVISTITSVSATTSSSGTPSIDYVVVIAAVVVVVGIVLYDFLVRRKSGMSKSSAGAV